MTMLASEVLAQADVALAAVSELATADLSALDEDQLLNLLRTVEKVRRKAKSFDQAPSPSWKHAVSRRGMCCAEPASSWLGCSIWRRPRARSGSGTPMSSGLRVQLSGERAEPLLPTLAAARAGGTATAKQADVIIRCLGKLRGGQLPVAELATAETFLVEQAELFHVATLAGTARRLMDTLLPDGTLADERWQQRHRFLGCVPNAEGMYRLTADLDSETAALALAVLHSLAASKLAADGDRDERTAGQRMHDAFRSVLKIALRSAELPRSAGVPATVLVTMTAEQFESRTGLAAISFGQRMSVDQALRIAGQVCIAWVVHDSKGGVLNYGTSQRCATEKQTLALIARDQGCAFPGCTDPPEWTEKHHVVAWSQGGRWIWTTSACCATTTMTGSTAPVGASPCSTAFPWFIPPAWLDPAQALRRNHLRDSRSAGSTRDVDTHP